MSKPCDHLARIVKLIRLHCDVKDGLIPLGEIVPGADIDDRQLVLDLLRADISAATQDFIAAEALDERLRVAS